MHPTVSIVIPAYGAADSLRLCLESLRDHAPDRCTITVLDDATPDTSVESACEDFHIPNFRYLRSPRNRGFVATCNWAAAEAREPRSDLLLLNSDTQVTEDFLPEMQAVLHLHEKHAVVTPRSNSATIFSVPFCGQEVEPAQSFQIWKQIRYLLPRYSIMPTAIGFCMLIKGEVLDRFGLFDDIYSPGYNEENDFVCRINRRGYSAVSANRAYVFHHESASFGTRRTSLEARNRRILLERYPEYPRSIDDYVRFYADPLEYFAELYRPHRPRILFDLFHLEPKHCGTSEVALNLLRAIHHLTAEEWDLYVGIGGVLRFFASELRGYRIFSDPPEGGMIFDLAFMPCQLPTWSEFFRMNRLAPRVSFTLLDVIAVRCEFLRSPGRRMLTRKTAELADKVFSISEFSRADFAAFFGAQTPMRVIHLGTNMAPDMGSPVSGEYVLVVGNSFPHKGVTQALENLGCEWPIVVLGSDANSAQLNDRLRHLQSGNLTRQSMRELFVKARLVVYPSYYEGFGLPIADALALGKPVIVLDNAVNRELESVLGSRNLHRLETLKRLSETVHNLYWADAHPAETPFRDWGAVATEYVQSFRELLSQEIDLPKLRARWDLLRTMQSM